MEAPKGAERVVGSRSRLSVEHREPGWRQHLFEVRAGGGVVCRVAALATAGGGLMLWIGAGDRCPELGAIALGVPMEREGVGALSSVLLGSEARGEAAAALARRLAAALRRPVHVFCGAAFDRFTVPLVERGLLAEIRSRPDCFVLPS